MTGAILKDPRIQNSVYSTQKAKAELEIFPKFIELSYDEKQLYSSDIFDETKKLVEISIQNPDKDDEECYGILLKEFPDLEEAMGEE
jgi:hypothetical protein